MFLNSTCSKCVPWRLFLRGKLGRVGVVEDNSPVPLCWARLSLVGMRGTLRAWSSCHRFCSGASVLQERGCGRSVLGMRNQPAGTGARPLLLLISAVEARAVRFWAKMVQQGLKIGFVWGFFDSSKWLWGVSSSKHCTSINWASQHCYVVGQQCCHFYR